MRAETAKNESSNGHAIHFFVNTIGVLPRVLIALSFNHLSSFVREQGKDLGCHDLRMKPFLNNIFATLSESTCSSEMAIGLSKFTNYSWCLIREQAIAPRQQSILLRNVKKLVRINIHDFDQILRMLLMLELQELQEGQQLDLQLQLR
jgi:hypothetical protein